MTFTSCLASDSLSTNSYTEEVPAHRRPRGPCSNPPGQSGSANTSTIPRGRSALKRQDQALQERFPPRPLIKTLCSSQRAAFTIPSAHWLPLASQPLFTPLPGSENVLLSLLRQRVQRCDPSKACGTPPALSTTHAREAAPQDPASAFWLLCRYSGAALGSFLQTYI